MTVAQSRTLNAAFRLRQLKRARIDDDLFIESQLSFSRHKFAEIESTPVTAEIYEEMCRSYDTGVAEFLDLSYVKPNILGNSRMLLLLK